ncbi:hypothetical protein MMC17_005769 [Xylographa soralifera]|nr:hypothetical protein [Xylographa soralifera]
MSTIPLPPCLRSCFLELPREIRDEIYQYLLEPEDEPPQSAKHAFRDRHFPIKHPRFVDPHFANMQRSLVPRIIYQNKLPLIGYTACLGLARTNKQLHNEISQLTASRTSRPESSYKIDIIMDRRCYPTWTSLPTSPRNVRYVDVNLRIFCTKNWFGDRGPGHHFQDLLRLLTRFLRNGPLFMRKERVQPDIKLESITVYVTDRVDLKARTARWNPSFHDVCQRLIFWVNRLTSSGALHQRMDVVRLCLPGGMEVCPVVDECDVSACFQKKDWASYGWALD